MKISWQIARYRLYCKSSRAGACVSLSCHYVSSFRTLQLNIWTDYYDYLGVLVLRNSGFLILALEILKNNQLLVIKRAHIAEVIALIIQIILLSL